MEILKDGAERLTVVQGVYFSKIDSLYSGKNQPCWRQPTPLPIYQNR